MGIIPIIATKRRDILDLAARCGASNVRVFGSAVRGEFGPDSDVDILIDLERGRSLLDIVALKQDLEDMLSLRVDVVTEAALSPYIRDDVIKEAVSL